MGDAMRQVLSGELTRAQQTHEDQILDAYEGLLNAQSLDERREYADAMVRLIKARDPLVTLHLEMERMQRVERECVPIRYATGGNR